MPEMSKSQNPEQKIAVSDNLIAVGKIISAKGLRGEFNVVPLSDVPERYEALGDVLIEFVDGSVKNHSVEMIKFREPRLYVKLVGVDDRTEAEKFRGAFICIGREDLMELPTDMYYEFDLVGIEVRTTADNVIGTVKRLERYPANDVFVIENEQGEIMLPAVREFVLDVNVADGFLVVNIPEDMPVHKKGKR